MPKPKRLTKEQKKRSLASKKGWETRRKRATAKAIESEQKLRANASKASGKKPRKSKKPNPRIELAELQKQLNEERKKREKAERKFKNEVKRHKKAESVWDQSENWVDIKEPGWLHSDGSLAKEFSSLRHRPEASDLWFHLDKFWGYDAAFAREAEEMAEYYDVPVREIYTLYMSP